MLGTILSVGATLLGGVAAKKAGRAQQQMYEMQAQAKEREARYIQLETAQRKAAGLMNLSAALGTLAAQGAARNVSSDSASLDVLQQAFTRESFMAINAEELAGLIRRRSSLDEARGLRGQGSVSRFQGNMAFATSLLRAGSTLASSFSFGGTGSSGGIGASLPPLSQPPPQLKF